MLRLSEKILIVCQWGCIGLTLVFVKVFENLATTFIGIIYHESSQYGVSYNILSHVAQSQTVVLPTGQSGIDW